MLWLGISLRGFLHFVRDALAINVQAFLFSFRRIHVSRTFASCHEKVNKTLRDFGPPLPG